MAINVFSNYDELDLSKWISIGPFLTDLTFGMDTKITS